MIDSNIHNKKSPKYYIRKYIEQHTEEFSGKTVVDFPAGNGATCELLYQHGAHVFAFDLFPQYFLFDKITCTQANIDEGIPFESNMADAVICQEGIEHFSDQLRALREFNRVLKINGKLIITTPSYSNLAAKTSYLLFESETFKQMPPNEWDDVWMSDNNQNLYIGHLFLLGLQKLRTLAHLSGFELKEARYMRLSKGSLVLFPLLYPFISISSLIRFWRKKLKYRKHPHKNYILSIYSQQLKLNISPKHLLNKHIFMIFEKKHHLSDIQLRNEENYRPFGKIM